jgi:hypothetical protein
MVHEIADDEPRRGIERKRQQDGAGALADDHPARLAACG